jgi:uncharacterized membrane protein
MNETLLHYLMTFGISMVPVIELRGAIPYGLGFGLPLPFVLAVSVLGNMVPVPFIALFIRRIFAWMRSKSPKLDKLVTKLEARAHEKAKTVQKYELLGLFILVAIPLPGTGAWTGALVAALMDMKFSKALPCVFLGVCIAAAIITAVTFGVIHIF